MINERRQAKRKLPLTNKERDATKRYIEAMKVTVNCDHKCHKIGLNEWIKFCPICGCDNPSYNPNAKCDLVYD